MFFYTISQYAQTLGKKSPGLFCSAPSETLRGNNAASKIAIDW
jgi:hypothetical protein